MKLVSIMNFSIEPQLLLPLALTLAIVFFLMLIWVLFRLNHIKSTVLAQNVEQEERLQAVIAQHFSEQLLHLQQNYQQVNQQQLSQAHDKQQLHLSNNIEQQMADLRIKLMRQINELQSQLANNQSQSLDQVINHLNNTGQANREELAKTLAQSSEQMSKRIDGLTQATDNRLQEISGQVEKRLAEGFEKTTKTFSDILQRLALIDDAQKKITELSTNVVSLQEVLNDKRSRGAFGEVQLNSLIRNVLPEQSFKLQHTL